MEVLAGLLLTVLPYMGDEGVLGGLQVLHDVLVQRVHVLHQPLRRGVVHLGEGEGEDEYEGEGEGEGGGEGGV